MDVRIKLPFLTDKTVPPSRIWLASCLFNIDIGPSTLQRIGISFFENYSIETILAAVRLLAEDGSYSSYGGGCGVTQTTALE